MASMRGMMNPIAFRKAARTFPLCALIPFHSGLSTESKLSMPYGSEASARAARERAVMVRTWREEERGVEMKC